MIELEVEGTPAPQGSATAMLINGRARLVPGTSSAGRKKHRLWRAAVLDAATGYLEGLGNPPPLDEPVQVWVTFRFAHPDSDRYRTRMATNPDIDKLLRSTFDSITESGMIVDDNRIWRISATKRYVLVGELPGATISIEGCREAEAEDRERRKADAKRQRATA